MGSMMSFMIMQNIGAVQHCDTVGLIFMSLETLANHHPLPRQSRAVLAQDLGHKVYVEALSASLLTRRSLMTS